MSFANPSIDEAASSWDSELLSALYTLVFSSPDREVAGVLVGQTADATRRMPLVRAAIPTAGPTAAFAHQTWAQVHADMARYYPDLESVGWYVSRPGHGVGLTETDLANHRRWFARPDQILLIVDSRTHQVAVYAWVGGQLACVGQGPVTRRIGGHASSAGLPVAALGMLVLIGVTLGVISFIVGQALGG
jgi:proteasome lid subunit RPN8/RPN11